MKCVLHVYLKVCIIIIIYTYAVLRARNLLCTPLCVQQQVAALSTLYEWAPVVQLALHDEQQL